MSYSNDGATLVCLVFSSFIIIPMAIADLMEEKIEREAVLQPVLNEAHEQAVAAVDTINYSDVVINTKSARKDSARYAKRIKSRIKHSGKDLLSLKRTDSYRTDTIHMQRPTEENTVHTYAISFPHETIYHDDTLWVYRYKSGSSSQYVLDTAKVSRDPRLSKYIKRYEHAIAQLEIARRQQKTK